MVNNVVLVGRITKNPELKTSTSGTSICDFNLAINRNFKNQNGEYEADFVRCISFNKTAELIEQFVVKGQLLSAQGRIQTRNYDDNTGRKVYVTEVVVSNISFLESKKNLNNHDNQGFAQNFEAEVIDMPISDDDLPF